MDYSDEDHTTEIKWRNDLRRDQYEHGDVQTRSVAMSAEQLLNMKALQKLAGGVSFSRIFRAAIDHYYEHCVETINGTTEAKEYLMKTLENEQVNKLHERIERRSMKKERDLDDRITTLEKHYAKVKERITALDERLTPLEYKMNKLQAKQ